MSDDDVAALRAAAHPLRLQMLSLLTGTSMSAAEVARELGITHANASYHLRLLARAGEVVEAGQEKVRGGTAKRYRHPWDDPARSPARGQGSRQAEIRAMGQELARRFGLWQPQSRTYTCDAELWVADDVWERVLELVEEAGALLHSEAKPPRTPGTRRAALTIAAFGMKP